MRWYLVFPIVLTLILVAALPTVASNQHEVVVDQGMNDLDAAIQTFENALKAGDIDLLMDCFLDDARAMPPETPALVGKPAIEAYFSDMFEQYAFQSEFEVVDVNVSGDYATQLGEWSNTRIPKAGGEPILEVDQCMFGYELVDGAWLINAQIWNRYTPNELVPLLPPALNRSGTAC